MRFTSPYLVIIVLVPCFAVADDGFDESKAIRKIELLGGKVTRDESLEDRPVIEIDFQESERFNDKFLHLLNSFPSVKSLNLEGTAISDAGIDHISELKHLTKLWIAGSQITESGSKRLKELLPNTIVSEENSKEAYVSTEIKRLGGNVIRDANIRSNPVVQIDLNGSTQFANKDVSLLTKCRSLQRLDISNTGVTDDGLKDICNLTMLRNLSLNGNRITDVGVSELNSLKSLRWLSLDGTLIADDGLKAISGLTGLVYLNLSNTRVTGSGFVELGEFKRLRNLVLCNTQFTNEGLQQLSKIPNLGYIDLRNSNVSDGGLKEIGKLQIAHLILDENPITNEGLKELATLKQLRTLSLKNTEISDDGMKHVKELKFLSRLYLSKTKVTDIGLHELVELTELELIALDETPVTNAGVRMLWKSLPKRGKVILR